MRKAFVIVALLAFAGVACNQEPDYTVLAPAVELTGYAGETVEESIQMQIDSGVICPLLLDILALGDSADIDLDTMRDIYLDTEPQLGSDEFEGQVWDGLVARC